MDNNYYYLIGQRLKIIRELLLLTIDEVKILTKITPTTLRRIESGAKAPVIKNTDILSNLYCISKELILDPKRPIPSWVILRRNILKKSKNNIFLINCINKSPTQRKAIQFRVMQSSYLNDFKSVLDLQNFIKKRYNWTYGYDEILMAIKSLINEGLLELESESDTPKKFRKTRRKTKDILSSQSILHLKLEELFASSQLSSVSPVFERMTSMLLALSYGEISRSDLYKKISYSNAHKNHVKTLKVLEDLKLVQQTEDKANNPNQKYRLTQKGIEFIKDTKVE